MTRPQLCPQCGSPFVAVHHYDGPDSLWRCEACGIRFTAPADPPKAKPREPAPGQRDLFGGGKDR